MGRRYKLTGDEWARIEHLPPGRDGDPGGHGADNRLFVNAVIWIARSGVPWRDLPERVRQVEFGVSTLQSVVQSGRMERGIPGPLVARTGGAAARFDGDPRASVRRGCRKNVDREGPRTFARWHRHGGPLGGRRPGTTGRNPARARPTTRHDPRRRTVGRTSPPGRDRGQGLRLGRTGGDDRGSRRDGRHPAALESSNAAEI